jgi:hypothetical protein
LPNLFAANMMDVLVIDLHKCSVLVVRLDWFQAVDLNRSIEFGGLRARGTMSAHVKKSMIFVRSVQETEQVEKCAGCTGRKDRLKVGNGNLSCRRMVHLVHLDSASPASCHSASSLLHVI